MHSISDTINYVRDDLKPCGFKLTRYYPPTPYVTGNLFFTNAEGILMQLFLREWKE